MKLSQNLFTDVKHLRAKFDSLGIVTQMRVILGKIVQRGGIVEVRFA